MGWLLFQSWFLFVKSSVNGKEKYIGRCIFTRRFYIQFFDLFVAYKTNINFNRMVGHTGDGMVAGLRRTSKRNPVGTLHFFCLSIRYFGTARYNLLFSFFIFSVCFYDIRTRHWHFLTSLFIK